MDQTFTVGDKYTKFTLALLEDSGWYKPDYDLADVLNFGYNKGCDFINKNCERWFVLMQFTLLLVLKKKIV